MEKSSSLVPANLAPVAMTSVDDVMRIGKVMAESGFFQDSRQAAQAVVKILAGQEMGFGPFASMTGVHIIQGRPAIGANLMAAAVKGSGRYDYRVTRLDDDGCEIAFYEKGQEIGRSSFNREDAKKAGTKNLDKFPRNMYFARAMSNGVRWYCPNAFSGAAVYTPEELGAEVNPETGEIIQGEYTVTPPAAAVQPETPKTNGNDKQSGPTPNPSFFMPGDGVVVRGKSDEKPGVVLEDNGNGTVLVRVDGNELKIGRDKLMLIPPMETTVEEAEG